MCLYLSMTVNSFEERNTTLLLVVTYVEISM